MFTFSATRKNPLHLIQKSPIQTDAEQNSVLWTFEIWSGYQIAVLYTPQNLLFSKQESCGNFTDLHTFCVFAQ